jgi:hypothetical protein
MERENRPGGSEVLRVQSRRGRDAGVRGGTRDEAGSSTIRPYTADERC